MKNSHDGRAIVNDSSAVLVSKLPPEPAKGEVILKKQCITTALGHQLEFLSCGQGEPVVILTALAFNSSIWKYQIEKFHSHYQLIFPHILPGHAGSVFNGKSFTFEELADDLAELLDHLGLSRVHVLGWCMAGNIAQLFTLRYPGRVKTLTLLCTTPTDARVRGLESQDLKSYAIDPVAIYEMEFKNIYQQRYYGDKCIREYLDLIKKSSCKVQEGAVLHHLYGVFNFDSTKKLKDITVPTMVMSGKWDIAFPPDQVKLLHQGIRHSVFHEFEMAGHLPFLNEHELFNDLLDEFLKSNWEDVKA